MFTELVVDGINGFCKGCPFLSICFLKEEHLFAIFSETRERNAGKSYALTEVYSIKDINCRAVDFSGIVRVDGQGNLLRKGFEICISQQFSVNKYPLVFRNV